LVGAWNVFCLFSTWQTWARLGVTRLAEFSNLGRFSLLSAAFWQISEVAKIFVYFFPRKKWHINFGKTWVWLRFWRFFHKLIRSPWPSLTGVSHSWKLH
jgi:hypothetical protein